MARKSSQKIVDNMASISPDTRDSIQEVLRQHRGEKPGTQIQDIMANATGVSRATHKSLQEWLFDNLKTDLGLSDPYTQYTEQDLLEMAESASSTLDHLLGQISFLLLESGDEILLETGDQIITE